MINALRATRRARARIVRLLTVAIAANAFAGAAAAGTGLGPVNVTSSAFCAAVDGRRYRGRRSTSAALDIA